MNPVPLGLGDRRLPIPSHLCLFHDSYHELQAQLRAFIQTALGDPTQGAALFGAPGMPAQLRRGLEQELGRSLDDDVDRGKLVLVDSDPDPDVYLERFREALDAFGERGYVTIRAFGRSTWGVPGFPLAEDHLWLEWRLEELIASSHAVLICAYDLHALPGACLAFGGLDAHRRIVVAGDLADNPSFVDPGHYFSDRLLRLPWLASS